MCVCVYVAVDVARDCLLVLPVEVLALCVCALAYLQKLRNHINCFFGARDGGGL